MKISAAAPVSEGTEASAPAADGVDGVSGLPEKVRLLFMYQWCEWRVMASLLNFVLALQLSDRLKWEQHVG